MQSQVQHSLETGNLDLPASNHFPVSHTVPSLGTSFKRLGAHVLAYYGLLITFLKLYFQHRVLVVQNFILTCRLHMWDISLLYLKVLVFFTRLGRGFPVEQCWPRK